MRCSRPCQNQSEFPDWAPFPFDETVRRLLSKTLNESTLAVICALRSPQSTQQHYQLGQIQKPLVCRHNSVQRLSLRVLPDHRVPNCRETNQNTKEPCGARLMERLDMCLHRHISGSTSEGLSDGTEHCRAKNVASPLSPSVPHCVANPPPESLRGLPRTSRLISDASDGFFCRRGVNVPGRRVGGKVASRGASNAAKEQPQMIERWRPSSRA